MGRTTLVQNSDNPIMLQYPAGVILLHTSCFATQSIFKNMLLRIKI